MLVLSLAGVARIVAVYMREIELMGTREEYSPIGKVIFICLGLTPMWWRAYARNFVKNRAAHVFWSSVGTDLSMLVACTWGVVLPENSDPTLLMCIALSLSWQCSVVSPFLRMGIFGLVAIINIVLEAQRGPLLHATFLAPAILLYQMYWAEYSARRTLVLQRHLWTAMPASTPELHMRSIALEVPREAVV